VDARGSRAPRTDALDLGQHLLPRPLAADLVEHALVDRDELIVEIGAGRGALTAALAERARAVIAIEVDPRFARGLRSMFAGDPVVRIVEGDARTWPLPREPFRAFGNVPFGITTDLFRHLLDDPVGAMVRADLIVQREVARKRVADPPRTVLSLGWGPWWTFVIERHLPARSFRPPPRVDAALLVIRRRERPLLTATEVQPYRRVVRELFVEPSRPVVQGVKAMVGESAGRLVSDVGVSHRARVVDLRIADAVALFRRMRAYWSEMD
jgi:23S rRNA (adenine-N6)-dimethyltransferase